MSLLRNLEELLFCSCANPKLQNAKREIYRQIKAFDIIVDANGFFEVNRSFVSAVYMLQQHEIYEAHTI